MRSGTKSRGASIKGFQGPAPYLRVDQQQQVCPLGAVCAQAPQDSQGCLQGIRDFLIGELRHRVSPLAQPIADADKGNIARHIVDGPVQEQDIELIYAGQGLEFALGQVLFLRIGQDFPVFPMGLAQGRIVIPPQDQVVNEALLRHIHQLPGGGKVLCPPSEPVLPVCLGNGLLEFLQLLLLLLTEARQLLFIQQPGILENIRPVLHIVVRLLDIALISLVRSAHQGIEDIDFQPGVILNSPAAGQGPPGSPRASGKG